MAELEITEAELENEVATDPTAPDEGPVEVFIYNPPGTSSEQFKEVVDNSINATPEDPPIYFWEEPSPLGSPEKKRPYVRSGC
jgi:hypothetical protein